MVFRLAPGGLASTRRWERRLCRESVKSVDRPTIVRPGLFADNETVLSEPTPRIPLLNADRRRDMNAPKSGSSGFSATGVGSSAMIYRFSRANSWKVSSRDSTRTEEESVCIEGEDHLTG